MNAEWMITNFVIMDDLMMHLDHHSHPLAQVPDSEILIIAVVAAKYFANHHERSVGILQQLGYLSGRISVSRFNRRLHALADWMAFMPQTLGALWTQGEVFVLELVARARARVSARPSASLSQGAWADLLRLLRGQAREILRLASIVGLYHGGRAGFLRPPAGVLARFNPGA